MIPENAYRKNKSVASLSHQSHQTAKQQLLFLSYCSLNKLLVSYKKGSYKILGPF